MHDFGAWSQRFHANLQKLFDATPFFNSTGGYFEQEFRGEWSASSLSVDVEKVISEHELNSNSKEQEDDADTSWFERFIAGITTEAKEIFEGAKNFAENFNRKDDNDGFDASLINKNFKEVFGWAQMFYTVQLFDIDVVKLAEM